MHAVILSRSGTSSLHSRVTSGVQACCISGVPRYCAFAPDRGQVSVESKIPATTAAIRANLASDFSTHCTIAGPFERRLLQRESGQAGLGRTVSHIMRVAARMRTGKFRPLAPWPGL
jgi:hypothetical protein